MLQTHYHGLSQMITIKTTPYGENLGASDLGKLYLYQL